VSCIRVSRISLKKPMRIFKIPLFVMFFDYQKYKKNGAKGSCDWYSHPNIMKDEYIRERMQECVDHIRESYDMTTFTEIKG